MEKGVSFQRHFFGLDKRVHHTACIMRLLLPLASTVRGRRTTQDVQTECLDVRGCHHGVIRPARRGGHCDTEDRHTQTSRWLGSLRRLDDHLLLCHHMDVVTVGGRSLPNTIRTGIGDLTAAVLGRRRGRIRGRKRHSERISSRSDVVTASFLTHKGHNDISSKTRCVAQIPAKK